MDPEKLRRFTRLLGVNAFTVCDPFYGIRHEMIAERLTTENWEEKALWRIGINGPVYVYLLHRYSTPEDDSSIVYTVSAALYDAEGQGRNGFSATFDDLELALAYANGDARTPFGVLTRNALPEEYPPEQGPQVFISSSANRGRS